MIDACNPRPLIITINKKNQPFHSHRRKHTTKSCEYFLFHFFFFVLVFDSWVAWIDDLSSLKWNGYSLNELKFDVKKHLSLLFLFTLFVVSIGVCMQLLSVSPLTLQYSQHFQNSSPTFLVSSKVLTWDARGWYYLTILTLKLSLNSFLPPSSHGPTCRD